MCYERCHYNKMTQNMDLNLCMLTIIINWKFCFVTLFHCYLLVRPQISNLKFYGFFKKYQFGIQTLLKNCSSKVYDKLQKLQSRTIIYSNFRFYFLEGFRNIWQCVCSFFYFSITNKGKFIELKIKLICPTSSWILTFTNLFNKKLSSICKQQVLVHPFI